MPQLAAEPASKVERLCIYLVGIWWSK